MTVRVAPLVALAALAVIAAVAGCALTLGLAPELRESLRFRFAHPRDLHAFGAIALNNARVALVPFAAALAVPFVGRALLVLDVGLVVLALCNCALIGVALAAYGGRLALALAAHAPLELAAMSLALATYIRARTTCPRRPRGLPRLVAGCLVLIVAAAGAEVWIS